MPEAVLDLPTDVQTLWVSILSLENCFQSHVVVQSFSRVPLFATPMDCMSVEFSRQGYGSGLPFPNNVAPLQG